MSSGVVCRSKRGLEWTWNDERIYCWTSLTYKNQRKNPSCQQCVRKLESIHPNYGPKADNNNILMRLADDLEDCPPLSASAGRQPKSRSLSRVYTYRVLCSALIFKFQCF